jgi:hypothetical protein
MSAPSEVPMRYQILWKAPENFRGTHSVIDMIEAPPTELPFAFCKLLVELRQRGDIPFIPDAEAIRRLR